MNIEIEIVIF